MKITRLLFNLRRQIQVSVTLSGHPDGDFSDKVKKFPARNFKNIPYRE
jgi:hypothetical protein